jgi:hypothetical protein
MVLSDSGAVQLGVSLKQAGGPRLRRPACRNARRAGNLHASAMAGVSDEAGIGSESELLHHSQDEEETMC